MTVSENGHEKGLKVSIKFLVSAQQPQVNK